MVVGIIGLLFSFVTAGDLFGTTHRATRTDYVDTHHDTVTTPHQHERVNTTDVVVEDDRSGTHVERVRRVQS